MMKKTIILMIGIMLFSVSPQADAAGNLDVRGSAIFNEDGDDNDFRIEGDNAPNLFVVDAGKDAFGFGEVADYSYGDTKFTFVSADKNNAMTFDVSQSNPIMQAKGMLFELNRTGSADVTNDTLGIKFGLNFAGSGNISGQMTPFLTTISFGSTVPGTSTVNTLQSSNFVAKWISVSNSRTWNITSVASDYLSLGQTANTGTGGITFSDFRHFYAGDSAAGTFTQQTGLWIDKQTRGTTNYGIVLDGDGEGADIRFGPSQETSIYSSGGRLYASDSFANQTILSPHDPETGEWIYYSKNIKTGLVKRVDMEKLVRAVEKLTGEKFMVESYEE